MSRLLTVFEHDAVVAEDRGGTTDLRMVPAPVFAWLESRCLAMTGMRWATLTIRQGRRAIKFAGHVGVLRAPCGFQIEILPKIGRTAATSEVARARLVQMLACMGEFRHILTDAAHIATVAMPLADLFIRHFLDGVHRLVRQGLRGGYVTCRGQLPFVRGKVLVAQQIRINGARPDRFELEYDEFLHDRPENRLIHAALQQVGRLCQGEELRRQARELRFVFADIPVSRDVARDFQAIRIERDMIRYEQPLAWARLILNHLSPVTNLGDQSAPSLLFPMDALFEAFVARHLPTQVATDVRVISQARSRHLVTHQDAPWFQLKPDLLIQRGGCLVHVLDTKWKLIDEQQGSSRPRKTP